MINLRIRTEYTFSGAYGPIPKVLEAIGDAPAAGITDRAGTWGHVAFSNAFKKAGKQPILGVELAVVREIEQEKLPTNYMAFLARNDAGLRELYGLVTEATSDLVTNQYDQQVQTDMDLLNFYYFPRIPYRRLSGISKDIIILSGTNPIWELLPRNQANLFAELAPSSMKRTIDWARETKRLLVATSDNYYPRMEHRPIYEIIAGRNRDSRTTPMHILDRWEWLNLWPGYEKAVAITHSLAKECVAELPQAKMVKVNSALTLEQMCRAAAPARHIDLTSPIYAARLRRELDLIAEKDFSDYFFVIADLLQYAKQHMMVGPARGSSCGSLVCYLLSITEIDPIPFDLIFERFIDINRKDLPDIDIDFADDRRDMVFEYCRQKYGADCVARLGTIMRYKAKSSIDAVSIALKIPISDTENLKGSIIERSRGDARAAFCILDTFNELEIGKEMLRRYPHLRIAGDIENHAKGTGQHAAGIVITQEPVSHFCSVNLKNGAVMLDKHDAESVNLLKIDALGLRTLSVIQDCLDQIGQTREWLMRVPLDDQEAFDVVNNCRFAGIFQFEGYALQSLCQQMKIEAFEDIASLGALGRPGPITSGGATEFIRRRNGQSRVTYLHPLCEEFTKVTYGIVIYQEQVMTIGHAVGRLSWEDVSSLRKAMSKSLGKEFFDQYWVKFLAGAQEQGVTEEEAKHVWENINSMGCLAGETEIPISSYGVVRIRDLAAKNKSVLIYCHLKNGLIRRRQLVSCWYSGKKETWRVKTLFGGSIRATKQHQFETSDGIFRPLRDLVVGDKVCVMGGTIPNSRGRKVQAETITFIGDPCIEDTYDIQMPDPDNNFVANGFIVHNSWSFNRSHAVAYGMVTYWCMVLKAHHPLEWATACLRNAAGEEQCIKLLRELDAEGYQYKAFDKDLSEINWSVKNGILIGGLLNLKGVGAKKASEIAERRTSRRGYTPAMQRLLDAGDTPFNYEKVFEARTRFKDILVNPAKYNIQSKIWNLIDITSEMEGEFVFLGKIVKVNLRDLNEPIHVQHRNGEFLTGQTLYLILLVEDNTSSIFVGINQRDYLELGKPIVEAGSIGKWYLWKGWLRRGFRKIYVRRYWSEERLILMGKG